MAYYASYGDLTTLRGMLGKAATDTADDVRLRLVLEAVTRLIDNQCRRHFSVRTGVRYFDGDTVSYGNRHQLWIDDLLSLTTLVADYNDDGTRETTITSADYLLWPNNSYPKQRIDLNLPASPDYTYWPDTQQSIAITGVWGYGDGDSATPYADSGTTVSVATTSGTTVAAVSGTPFAVGNTIRALTEDMYITGISGNNLTVVRGVNGTTAVVQPALTPAYIYAVPAPVREACLLQAGRLFGRRSSMSGVVGASDLGQIYIPTKLDPDVAMLLGDYMNPRSVA